MEYVTEKIIQYVLSQNEFKTAKQIAANINVSESSVKHNIAEAKMILSKAGGKLLSVPGKGFILESSSSDIEILEDEVFKLNFNEKIKKKSLLTNSYVVRKLQRKM